MYTHIYTHKLQTEKNGRKKNKWEKKFIHRTITFQTNN